MATTVNYNWLKPTVGADAGTWGTELNQTLDNIDTQMALSATKASPTFSGQITSTLANGTAPLVVASSTQVANLNSTFLQGANWAAPLAIGGTTPAAGTFTTLAAASLTVSGALTATLTGSAVSLATGRTISLTGDLTATTGAFNGTGAVTAAATLATVNANVGAFGDTTHTLNVTVNGKGLVTAISTNAIPTAAIGTAGLVALAASSDVITGTDTAKAVTAASLASQQALATPGYITHPGGMIQQWGTSSGLNNGQSQAITFPHAFATAAYVVVISASSNPSTGGMAYAFVSGKSASGFTVNSQAGAATTFDWTAIGK